MKSSKQTELKQTVNGRTSILWQPLHDGDAAQFTGGADVPNCGSCHKQGLIKLSFGYPTSPPGSDKL